MMLRINKRTARSIPFLIIYIHGMYCFRTIASSNSPFTKTTPLTKISVFVFCTLRLQKFCPLEPGLGDNLYLDSSISK